MKRLISLIITVLTCITVLSSCSPSAGGEGGHVLRIVSTAFPGYDLARQITKGADPAVHITMLLPPGSESHDYEASLSDVALIGEADVVIRVGEETDGWIDDVVRASGSSAVVLTLTDMVPLYEEGTDGIFEGEHHHTHDRDSSHAHVHDEDDGNHDHSGYDEHVWTSPANAAVMCESICASLSALSDDNRVLFESNAADYAASLRELDNDMRSMAESARRDTLIFADRFPFRYLTERLGVGCYAAFAGCSSDAEPSLATVYHLTEIVRELDAPAVLKIEFSSGRTAQVIAEETGARVLTLHSCHNVSKEEFDSGVTYLQLMRQNLAVLKEALN